MPTKEEAKSMTIGDIIKRLRTEGIPQKQAVGEAYGMKGQSRKKKKR